MPETSTKNREAQSKGFRLQKLRVLEVMFNELAQKHNTTVYGAVELLGDVYVRTSNHEGEQLHLEENKNYDSKNFTFNSHEVINTMVIFLESWIFKLEHANHVKFVFYATNEIGKERKTDKLKKEDVTLPSKPILKLLSEQNFEKDNLLEAVKKMILMECKEQYGNAHRMLKSVEDFSDDTWKKFLTKIEWSFGSPDEKDLENTLLKQIQDCELFNTNLEGKEKIILAYLLEELESRQQEKEIQNRSINNHFIKMAYLEIAQNPNYQYYTPQEIAVYDLWDKIPPPDANRNFEQKIIDVCTEYIKETQKLRTLTLVTTRGTNHDYKKCQGNNKNEYLNIKYWVYESCMIYLSDIENHKKVSFLNRLLKQKRTFSVKEIDEILGELCQVAQDKLSQKEYQCDLDEVTGMIYELFNSCYLSFDK